MKNIIILICLKIILLNVQVNAQIPEVPKNVQSPNVATLGLYGEIPVSNFTGVPNIEIPLYSLKDKNFEVPISLSYHASGFRPDMHPGWVGMGWNLSSGGVISRVVKDETDEHYNYKLFGNVGRGYYFNYGVLNNDNWNKNSFILDIVNAIPNFDTEPDEFSFNFPGYSGSFYINEKGNVLVKCDRNVRVSILPSFIDPPFPIIQGTKIAETGNSKAFYSFDIVTEDGTRYRFGNNANAIEYSIGFFSQKEDEWVANAWYLTQIFSPYGESLATFTYERDDYINQMYISYYADLGSYVNEGPRPNVLDPSCSSSSIPPLYQSYAGQLVSPVYLKEIRNQNTVLKFERSTSTELRYQNDIYEYQRGKWYDGQATNNYFPFLPYLSYLSRYTETFPKILDGLQWKKLDRISAERLDGTLITSFQMKYNNIATERLTLLSVTERGLGSSANPTQDKSYGFFYDQSQPLPPYLANKTDHWGFYNGTYADVGIGTPNFVTEYYPKRNPKEMYLYAGTLNKIVYPTGGYTELSYEPHQYSMQLQFDRSLPPQSLASNELAGGLRIKKISSYDPATAKKTEKEYFYVYNYSANSNPADLKSSGVLGGQIKYYNDRYLIKIADINYWTTYVKKIFLSQSVLPGCINSQGSHVGYSEVVEKRNDGSFTRFNYTNFDNGHTDEKADATLHESLKAYDPYSSTQEERGKLLKEETYNASNILLSSRELQYTAFNKQSSYARSMKTKRIHVCSGGGSPALVTLEGTSYRLYTYSYLPIQEKTTLFDESGLNGVVTLKNYTYTSNKQLAEVKVANSGQEELTTVYRYPNDMINNNLSGIYSQMEALNISPIVEEIKYLNKKEISYSRYNYSNKYFNRHLPYMVESKIYLQNSFDTLSIFRYDNKSNPVMVTKPYGMKTCYVWGYGGFKLIAKIENAEYDTVVDVLGGESNVKYFRDVLYPDSNLLLNYTNRLRKDDRLKTALISTYIYKPLVGLVSMTDAKGMTTSYDYDGLGRLISIKDLFGNILRNYQYNYARPIFRSAALSGTFTKNNCPSGQRGGNVNYTLPEGAITAASQAEADALALQAFKMQGQSYANQNGSCITNFSMSYYCYLPYGRTFNLCFLNTDTGEKYYRAISGGGSVTDIPLGSYYVTINESSYSGQYHFTLDGVIKEGIYVQYGPLLLNKDFSLYIRPK